MGILNSGLKHIEKLNKCDIIILVTNRKDEKSERKESKKSTKNRTKKI